MWSIEDCSFKKKSAMYIIMGINFVMIWGRELFALVNLMSYLYWHKHKWPCGSLPGKESPFREAPFRPTQPHHRITFYIASYNKQNLFFLPQISAHCEQCTLIGCPRIHQSGLAAGCICPKPSGFFFFEKKIGHI